MTNPAADSPRYAILIPEETWARAQDYLRSVQSGASPMGKRLEKRLAGQSLEGMSLETFFGELFETKKPRCFAERDVYGDGTDWNLTELGLLGDVSVAVPVTIFDDGRHTNPSIHQPPFKGTLVYTPGALLKSGRGPTPADWDAVVVDNATCDEAYYTLYRRRLLPAFEYVNAQAPGPRSAVLTIPGLGCGMFAGKFKGTLGAKFETVLARFLHEHGEAFPNIEAIYYDPYGECDNAKHEIHGISFFVRPLLKQPGNGKPQLCRPADYAETGDDFSHCELFSIVAWDHVSWPGNDFYAGARSTDDGVKAAATDSMAALTGAAGEYSKACTEYQPPSPHHTWEQVVEDGRSTRNLRLWNPAAVWRQRLDG